MNWLKEILNELTYEGKSMTTYRFSKISELPETTLKRIIDKNTPIEKTTVGVLHRIVLGVVKHDSKKDYTLTLLTLMDKNIK